MKKYEFTGETKLNDNGVTLNRIRALTDIKNARFPVHENDLGGWIECQHNLLQENACWVYDQAEVYDDAQVLDDATVSDEAKVCGNVCVRERALIRENAIVFGRAIIKGCADVRGYAYIHAEAFIGENSVISGEADIGGKARILLMRRIPVLQGKFDQDAYITEHSDYMVIGPIGSRKKYTTFFKNQEGIIKVSCGCFSGTLEEFLKKVSETHGENCHGQSYRMAASLAEQNICHK